MATDKTLETYRAKRNFRRTSEPEGGKTAPAGEAPVFVIQKHQASTLHYDFRLEVDGVLKSWAVPKGPSTDPRVKRLAIPTEDHPMEYTNFEGSIPEGEYGAGTAIIWDRGTYLNLRAGKEEGAASMETSLEQGMVEIWLEGEKIRGGYALVRTGKNENARWLLIKMKDEQADARRRPTSTEPRSVVSGKTLEEVAQAKGQRA